MGKFTATRFMGSLAFLAALFLCPLPINPSPISFFAASRLSFSADAPLLSTSTPEGRLAVFDDVWETINSRYYDRNFHGLDWDAQRTTFRALALKAQTGTELYAVVRSMIGSLNDPHTRVFAPDEKFDWWRPRVVTVGFSIAEVDGQPTVIRVERDSAAERAGLQPGDVVETVDSKNALAVIRERLGTMTEAKNTSLRFRVFNKLLDGPAETSVKVTWKTKHGKRKSAQLSRYWLQRELGIRVTRERSDYAVLEIDAFTRNIANTFKRSLAEKLKDARGVILDLRRNGGGDAEAMSDIASTFLGLGVDLGQFTNRAGFSFDLFTQSRSANPVAEHRVPLIVLTSPRTASAAEIFVEALRASRRATILGTETCGCVLAVRARHDLPDGGVLDVSELDYETAQGRRIEGHGLKPDETVLIERKDLYAGRDRAKELALDKLDRLRNR
jgi:carboxyl-terminal processing protease